VTITPTPLQGTDMRASLTRKVAIITAGAALASWTLIAAQPAGAWPVDFASCNTVTLTSDLTTQTTGQLLRLAPHCTYDLTAALPDITAQPVTIWAGPGTVLERSTAPDAPPFSLLTVDSGASLTVSGLTLTGAVASTGGAIDNYGTLTVTRSTFTDDTAAFGGAIASGLNGSATLTISRSDFTSNNASSKGGAVANWSSGTATITGSTFTDNYAENWGGAIYSQGSTTVSGSAFTGNSTTYSGGGGIATFSGSLMVHGGVFTGNTGYSGGGGVHGGGDLSVTGSTFTRKTADYSGGALLRAAR
jgi:predicted outer membrane repeat protein